MNNEDLDYISRCIVGKTITGWKCELPRGILAICYESGGEAKTLMLLGVKSISSGIPFDKCGETVGIKKVFGFYHLHFSSYSIIIDAEKCILIDDA
jgi:hypothetical protein